MKTACTKFFLKPCVYVHFLFIATVFFGCGGGNKGNPTSTPTTSNNTTQTVTYNQAPSCTASIDQSSLAYSCEDASACCSVGLKNKFQKGSSVCAGATIKHVEVTITAVDDVAIKKTDVDVGADGTYEESVETNYGCTTKCTFKFTDDNGTFPLKGDQVKKFVFRVEDNNGTKGYCSVSAVVSTPTNCSCYDYP